MSSPHRKRLGRLLVALGILVLTAAAVLGLSRARHAEADMAPRVVRISTGNTFLNGKRVFTGLQAVIVERNLFAELERRNVKVEWVPIAGAQTGPLINEGFANGSIDVAGYGDLPSIIANAEGVKTKLIVPTGRGSETYLLVPNDSTARSLADLKGKRIAIHRGRPWELPLSRLIDSLGLSYADFEILNLNTDAGAAALAAKKVDALYTINAHLLVQKGAGKIIWSTDQAPADWKMRAELWASAAFVEGTRT
jgi:sulfonate transport system substrate-binding protein